MCTRACMCASTRIRAHDGLAVAHLRQVKIGSRITDIRARHVYVNTRVARVYADAYMAACVYKWANGHKLLHSYLNGDAYERTRALRNASPACEIFLYPPRKSPCAGSLSLSLSQLLKLSQCVSTGTRCAIAPYSAAYRTCARTCVHASPLIEPSLSRAFRERSL